MAQNTVRRFVLDLLDGLELAHRRGVIHRDIKPANIFLDGRGTAKLGDFGVAHLLDLGQTQTGGLIGTLAYMSPEQITGASLTISADLYAVGVTLFEALTGRLPFLGPDFVAEHLGAVPPAPSSIKDELSPEWDPVLAKLLAKNPDDRYATVDELRHALIRVNIENRGSVLLLPRAKAGSALTPPQKPAVAAAPVQAEEASDRYEFETSLGRSSASSLSRALDRSLGRSVIIERFDPGTVGDAEEERLYALARGGGPFLQRALSYDRSAGMAVFEAPSGAPIADRSEGQEPSMRWITRLLKRLARALAPVHRSGHAHGAISSHTVLLDELGYPTIMISGIGPAPENASPQADTKACIALARQLMSSSEIEGLSSASTGDELYELAEALEVAVVKKSFGAESAG